MENELNNNNNNKSHLKVIKGLGYIQPLTEREKAELDVLEIEYMRDVNYSEPKGIGAS